jgi:hypothetical protein
VAETLHVEGLQELLQAFGRMDKSLSREVRREYRTIGALVARRIKTIAEAEGLRGSARTGDHQPGALIRGVRPAVKGSTLVVQDLVRRNGFPYPQVAEGWISGHGEERPFMEPGLDASTQAVVHGFEDMLDRISSIGGFGGRVT